MYKERVSWEDKQDEKHKDGLIIGENELNNLMIPKENDVMTGWLSDKDVNEAVFDNVTPINIYNEWVLSMILTTPWVL